MTSPKITYVIPKKNNRNYYYEAISSACNQTLPPYQVIVSENYSTDGSFKETVDLIDKFPNIQVMIPDRPLSYGENLAFGLSHVKEDADYVCIGASDDLWDPKFLEKMAKKMDSNKDAVLGFCDYFAINSVGNKIGASGSLKKKLCSSGKEGFLNFLYGGCQYIITGSLFRKEMITNKNTIEIIKNSGNSADWILQLESSRVGSVIYYPFPLFYWRVHDQSTTFNKSDNLMDKPHLPALKFYSKYLMGCDQILYDELRNFIKNKDNSLETISAKNQYDKYKTFTKKIQYFIVKIRLFGIIKLLLK